MLGKRHINLHTFLKTFRKMDILLVVVMQDRIYIGRIV